VQSGDTFVPHMLTCFCHGYGPVSWKCQHRWGLKFFIFVLMVFILTSVKVTTVFSALKIKKIKELY